MSAGSGRRIPPWGWLLVAVRLVAMLVTLALHLALYYLLAPFTRHNPVPRWFLRAIGHVAGLEVRTQGSRPAPGTFILANHVSWLDIPALASTAGSAFVAHDGLARIAPLRWLCRLNRTVFIARHERRSVAAQVGQVRAALGDAGVLTIFPEGTTSDGTARLAFKSSLLSALEGLDDVPVQPVRLDYGRDTRAIAWVGEEPGLDNALRILARWRPIRLTVRFLPPLTPAERSDRKRMAAAAQAAIERAGA
ncbi:lysophospholipid acyltransferase family protein [Novosphingobium soli]|uniref:Lysophospholipid acyltransferase family protein n=1 Tax=Novosphingobium soli TaxID=574956 RepID=A0ABV6CUA4_9SPHN